ncbi:hypothetical protein [Pseudomonas protegens]
MKFKVGHLSIVRGLKLILLVVGALTILKYGAITLLSLSSDSDDDVTKLAYLSPNGKYSAVHVTSAGGGAVAPFCSDTVFVFNSLQTIDEVIAHPEYQVYSAECDVFFDHEASPTVKWDSDSDLQIDFAIGASRIVSRDVKLRASDASGKIQVRFSAYR